MIKVFGHPADGIPAFEKRLERMLPKIAEEIAEKYFQTLKGNIMKNAFGYSLDLKTIQQRKRKGIKSRIPLYATGDYVKSIVREGTKVKVKEGMHYSGLTYNELAFIMEFGRRDAKIFAFPYWRKTMEEMQPEVRELVKKRLKELK